MRGIVLALLIATAFAGCVSDASEPDESGPDGEPVPTDILAGPTFVNHTGIISNIPGAGQQVGSFVVPFNTGRMTATLLWNDAVADLSFTLESKDDTAAGGLYDGPGNGRAEADLPGPPAGNWTYHIHSENAVRTEWQLIIYMAPDDAVTMVIAESYVIPSGAFFEINTEMPLNGTMQWDWTIDEGSDSAFNVHTHFDGEVQYLIEETTNAHAGKVVADRAGGYSLMWENNGPPQTLTYRAWGDFTVDSYYPPR